jgi:hypothetical protein
MSSQMWLVAVVGPVISLLALALVGWTDWID